MTGISEDTPLGKIMTIRSETDADRLKQYTADMMRIRSQYRSKQAKKLVEQNPEVAQAQIDSFQAAMKAAFYNPQ